MNELSQAKDTTRVDCLQIIRTIPAEYAPDVNADCALYPAACMGYPCVGCGDSAEPCHS